MFYEIFPTKIVLRDLSVERSGKGHKGLMNIWKINFVFFTTLSSRCIKRFLWKMLLWHCSISSEIKQQRETNLSSESFSKYSIKSRDSRHVRNLLNKFEPIRSKIEEILKLHVVFTNSFFSLSSGTSKYQKTENHLRTFHTLHFFPLNTKPKRLLYTKCLSPNWTEWYD